MHYHLAITYSNLQIVFLGSFAPTGVEQDQNRHLEKSQSMLLWLFSVHPNALLTTFISQERVSFHVIGLKKNI